MLFEMSPWFSEWETLWEVEKFKRETMVFQKNDWVIFHLFIANESMREVEKEKTPTDLMSYIQGSL